MSSFQIGLFGGSFNPFHNGHLYCLKKTLETFNLSWIEVVLAYKNPLKASIKDSPDLNYSAVEKRPKMLEIALKPYKKKFRLNDLELKRKGLSYTIDTLLTLKKNYKGAHFYLIIGFDQWKKFHLWKKYNKILKEATLIIFFRKGDPYFKNFNFSSNTNRLFNKLIHFQKNLNFNHFEDFKKDQKLNTLKVTLKNNQILYFTSINQGSTISSTLIRSKIKKGEDISKLVPLRLKNYISKEKLYL